MQYKVFKGNKDYNKLYHLPFNRRFTVRQDLIKNMNKYGFTTPIHLIKTDIFDGVMRLYIADGQHRAITASFLDITFYAFISPTKFKNRKEIVEYVADLNTGQKPWKNINYVESYNYLNYPEYTKLLKFTNESPFSSVDTIASLLYGIRSRGGVTNKIKSGEFKCNLIKETNYTLNLVAKLSKYERVTSRMVHAIHYLTITKSFNESKFIKKYKANAKSIKELKLDDYTDVFSSWLN